MDNYITKTKPIKTLVDPCCFEEGPISFSEFLEKYPMFNENKIRYFIGEMNVNGLSEANVVFRIKRRIFIDEKGFFDWLEDSSK